MTMSPDSDPPSESAPLLGRKDRKRKAFYRPRPLWLVPFALVAATVRGMTTAPRVQVFTQLSCAALYDRYNHTTSDPTPLASLPLHDPAGPSSNPTLITFSPPAHPSCLTSPDVQSLAAKHQTLFTLTSGLLSSLTTPHYAHASLSHGRTRILALATLGLLLTDLAFLLLSLSPNASRPSTYHTALLLLSPALEGLLGSWSTLAATTTAYVSDCTSPGTSRASIFARFSGVSFFGFSLGPVLAAALLRHLHTTQLAPVFAVASACSLANLLLVLFLFPESVSAETRARAKSNRQSESDDDKNPRRYLTSLPRTLFAPLAVFLPTPQGTHLIKNWDLTWLAVGLFGYLLSTGIYQIKYLYAEHVFSWGTETLGYYISFASGMRALVLLLVIPYIISTFKRRSPSPPPTSATTAFDLLLLRLCLLLDAASHALVALSPSSSAADFVFFSGLSCFGSGVVPAAQSLALCLVQEPQEGEGEEGNGGEGAGKKKGPTEAAGKILGAMASLQAIAQMILGPTLFGLIYSTTVRTHPSTIFLTASLILLVSLASLALLSVRSPSPTQQQVCTIRRVKGKRVFAPGEEVRGRSKARKALGAARGACPV